MKLNSLIVAGLFGFLAISSGTALAEEGMNIPTPAEAIAQMGFMEGDWELTTFIYEDDGSVAKQSSARMSVRPALGGLGYLEERYFPNDKPGGRNYAVATLFAVKPDTGLIAGALNNTLGNRKFLNQVEISEKLVFEMRGELFKGAKGHARLRYTNITENSFEMIQDYCPEDGKPCQEKVFSFEAARVGRGR